MSACFRTLTAALAVVIATAAPAMAGQQQWAAMPDATPAPPTGWSLTPGMSVSQTWDDNVLLRGPGDPRERDLLNVVTPRADMNFNGARGQFAARYDGSYLFYRSLGTLNSYEQHGSVSAKRRVSRRNAFFFTATAADAPTTEFLQLTGVPYVRIGSRTEDGRGGIETTFNKRVSLVANVHVQQVTFARNTAFNDLLLGGNSVGGGFVLRDRLSERTTLTADYDLQRANIGVRHDIFDVQNATVGFERQLTQTTRVSAAAGIARLGLNSLGPAKTGPSWRVGVERSVRASLIEVFVYRSFVPSWSFGGTTQNEEATLRFRLPLSRHIYTTSMVSWRREDALLGATTPQLRSVWVQGAVGYAARPWMRFEGYFLGTRQTADRDELLAHNQIGFQIIASKPVRLR